MKDGDALLTPGLLLQAYRAGVFPMSEGRNDPEVFWVDPKWRGIIPLDEFHISRSLARRMRRQDYQISFDADFRAVVAGCADREETWINATIFDLYQQLHHQGHAHSIEVWQDEQLVGGVYGVTIGAAFFGESMFSRATDASKLALAYLVDHLRQQGFMLFDTQFITPHLARLGAVEIPRATYHTRLEAALQRQATFVAATSIAAPQDVIQRNAQTS